MTEIGVFWQIANLSKRESHGCKSRGVLLNGAKD
jgi:hypothetical protein